MDYTQSFRAFFAFEGSVSDKTAIEEAEGTISQTVNSIASIDSVEIDETFEPREVSADVDPLIDFTVMLNGESDVESALKRELFGSPGFDHLTETQ